MDAYANVCKISSDSLMHLLGEATCNPASVVGKIDEYFVLRYGFQRDTVIVPFSGDNPCTIVGLNLQVNDLAISLGTSTTIFSIFNDKRPNNNNEGHVFRHPVNKNSFMAMLCFKNGSLPRDVRSRFSFSLVPELTLSDRKHVISLQMDLGRNSKNYSYKH
jgi:xylulokinase